MTKVSTKRCPLPLNVLSASLIIYYYYNTTDTIDH